MDRRLTPGNGRVAHVSLKGQVEAERFTEGKWRQVETGTLPIFGSPGGARTRELLQGERFCVLDSEDGFAFGFAGRDGYVGWVPEASLGPEQPATHRVSAIRSHWQEVPDIKRAPRLFPLSFGARVRVTGTEGRWSRLALPAAPDAEAPEAWMPTAHLAPVDSLEADPVAVAEAFLGTPYVWGGNSAFGIDCSGLVQAALLACGTACPGDSDMQMALGEEATGPHQRGDLLFWKGHVAMVTAPDTLLHANAGHMAVAYEGIEAATRRIAAQGEGPMTARRRLPAA